MYEIEKTKLDGHITKVQVKVNRGKNKLNTNKNHDKWKNGKTICRCGKSFLYGSPSLLSFSCNLNDKTFHSHSPSMYNVG